MEAELRLGGRGLVRRQLFRQDGLRRGRRDLGRRRVQGERRLRAARPVRDEARAAELASARGEKDAEHVHEGEDLVGVEVEEVGAFEARHGEIRGAAEHRARRLDVVVEERRERGGVVVEGHEDGPEGREEKLDAREVEFCAGGASGGRRAGGKGGSAGRGAGVAAARDTRESTGRVRDGAGSGAGRARGGRTLGRRRA